MDWFRKSPLFFSALIALGLILAGEGWCWFGRARAAGAAQKKYEQKRRELRTLTEVRPALNREVAAEIERDLARTEVALAAMRTELRGRGEAAGLLHDARVPERRPDAYFDIATFVEKMRDRAQAQGVGLKADERFGFAAYANAGPEQELIAPVFRQRLLAQHLLVALFDSRPRQLVSMLRARPLTKAEQQAGRAGPAPGGESADYFEIDPRVSARVPGFVETTAFRVVFVGPTAALRAWLNRLAAFDLPFVVRAVEVEPAGREAGVPAPAANAATPLVPQSLSRFSVTVEFIDLASTGEAPAS
jgi:hypothetical protein